MANHKHMTATTVAVEKADAEPHNEALWNSPETWIVVSFLLFIALFIRYVVPKLNKGLDGRSATIRNQLEQASRLRA